MFRCSRIAFLDAVTRVRIAEPVGREVQPEWGLSEGPRIEWTEVAEAQSIADGYAVGIDEGGRSYVRAVGSRWVALAAKSDFDRLRNATGEEFVRTEEPSESAADAATR